MKKAAIVILNWNGEKLLEQFLPSVIDNPIPKDIEIVVADNCSTDDSVEFLTNKYPQIRLITLSENYGYAGGYNKALEQIDAEYFILLNSDVQVTKGCFSTIIEFLDQNSDVAAVQPKICSYKNKSYFEYAGASGGYIDKLGYPFCRGRIFDTLEKDNGQYNTAIDIFWASGACLIIRSKDFFDVGGFDESFFAHMEEIDLCWRLNARGRRIICLPQSVVYHVGGATLNGESPNKLFLNFRNNLLMLYKNLPVSSLKKTLRIRKYLDYLAAIHYLLKGKIQNTKAILKAHREFKRIKIKYNDARQENLRNVTQINIKTIYSESILKAYYIKGLKIFSELGKF